MRKILIFDTTLRDGEQAPGCAMSLQTKVSVARQLERLGVDIIEAGFPAASEGDFAAVQAIAGAVREPVVCAFARATQADIDAALAALSGAAKPMVNILLATSPIHMKSKLRMTPEQVLERAADMTAYAAARCAAVEFSAEDAIRSDFDFLCAVIRAVAAAGATTVNIPDTVGYTTPHEIYRLFKRLRETLPELAHIRLATHCHNDLGMAVANSLCAVEGGADQVECTVNGIGERAGNAALEEIVMALLTRRDHFQTGVDLYPGRIYRTCRMLASVIGRPVPPNKPIVGANAFAHEAGIHQHGVLADPSTYEIMSPQTIGIPLNAMVLGKHSGRHGFEDRLTQLGVTLSKEELDAAFEQFKKLADRKNEIGDKDLETIIGSQMFAVEPVWTLVRFIVSSGNTIPGTATVKLACRGEEIEQSAVGDGPVDAAFKAICHIVGQEFHLADFTVHSVGEGEDAQGEVTVRLLAGERLFIGRGFSTDIIEASLSAYVNAINRSLK